MRHRVRRKRGGFLFAVIFLVVGFIFIILLNIEKNIAPAAENQSRHYSELMANRIINETVLEYLSENKYKYSDFAAVLYDENGKAASIEAITYNINKVQSDLSVRISEKLSENKNIRTKIPLGSLTDSYLLAGKGPSVPLEICPEGNVKISLKSEFVSAGLNQTCHRISAVISTDIKSAVPLYSFYSEAEFEFLIAENVIVGEVPDYRADIFQ